MPLFHAIETVIKLIAEQNGLATVLAASPAEVGSLRIVV